MDSLLDSLNEEQETQAQEYINRAHAVLDRAQAAAINIECNRRSAQEHAQLPRGLITANSLNPPVGELEMARPKLPCIPIPTFSGNVWEFQNFWTLFSENVHNQPLSKLQKFNYLLNALQGEARESVRRYPVTEDNYDHAVHLLCTNYGDDTKFIACLQVRLENAKAENTTIQAQRKLLEFIIPIITQLEEKGVQVNGSFLAQKILSKFSIELQRRVLESRLALPSQEDAWSMRDILSDLDKLISTEERINDMVNRITCVDTRANVGERKRFFSKEVQMNAPCIFCGGTDHKSVFCYKYTTLADRRAAFRENSRCLNCGIPGHFVKECTKSGCKTCKGQKHHHTLCPQRTLPPGVPKGQPSIRKDPPRVTPRQSMAQQGPPKTAKEPKRMQAHSVEASESAIDPLEDDTGNSFGTVLSSIQKQAVNQGEEYCEAAAVGNVLLLTGVAQVRDLIHNIWRDVEVLFDTGADQSFISEGLVKELGLKCTAQKDFMIYTFGTEKPKHTTCSITALDLRNQEGEKHELSLYTAPLLTSTSKSAQLSAADMAFIAQHQIRLSKKDFVKTSKPQILLGCDQLWHLLDVPYPRYTLPSGLQLVPSKIGYLITGQQHNTPTHGQKGEQKRIVPVNAVSINTLVNFDDEYDRWDKYWTMDSAGVCEFTGTKNAEKCAINEQVAKFFEETIEKREDGYYVRYPYKEKPQALPTNKAIALQRLRSVLQALRKTPELLQEYDRTFKTQEEKGIIEEVLSTATSEESVVHYIPHQPVLTPHKETTKLRIVFDASAHFKDRPSLNDVLHQGPLILPDLYAVLLRFRLPAYVITSDVEKAFLQVRLHEAERDATRFLWVKDLNAPVDDDNIAIFRFTRVTFGLNVSPYLLGATIQYHLRFAVQDRALASEIQENLYVDNLVLLADTKEEALQKAKTARTIFEEMGMNLREFLSNDSTLCANLPKEACARSTTQKVLGVQWCAENDCMITRCPIGHSEVVTKRTVARQIASIFDPLGWLVPLLTRAKIFQQDLWKLKFQWDVKLPQHLCSQWTDIVDGCSGFEKVVPRRINIHPEAQNLAVFADASEGAIAACAYLFNEDTSALVMAKGKLPSIKNNTTIPKLEMNALTLATRLAYSILQALKSRTMRNPRTIYLFSDSLIVLGWISSTRKTSLGVLVENRLREIRRIAHTLENEGYQIAFAYVNTCDNPADAGTRGLSKEQAEHHFWWTGPQFLTQPVKYWYNTFYTLVHEEKGFDECANVNAVSKQLTPPENLIDYSHHSSLRSAKRVTALVLRFIKKLLRATEDVTRQRIYARIPELKEISDSATILEGKEIRAARSVLIRNHQLTYLKTEYRKSMENTLRLYEDEHQVWRSRGRIGNSALDSDTISPIFIAPNTAIARLIIQEAHGNFHKGIEHTMASVREHYWIPKLRQQVRKFVTNCVKCRRFNGLPYHYPSTSDLPQRRVLRSRPFQHIGLDFFDLPSCTENGEKVKLYGCIFTCAVTRLIHLEVVRSMSTDDFLNALRRFSARRGVPESITCDNAPTFLLSANILSGPQEGIILSAQREIADNEISWNYITPYAPWQGGFYERLIKSVKHSLYKALRSARQRSFDEIHTFVVEVEACLNSRPLTYQGSSQEELSSIRPIDFVQSEMKLTLQLKNIVDDDNKDDPSYLPPNEARALQCREQVVQALRSSCQETEKFWNLWQQHYLTSLRESHRKITPCNRLSQCTPAVGDVVLISDPVLPRNDWRLARITATRGSADGKIREAELVTATRRKIRRPVNLLIPLEIQDSSEGKEQEAMEAHQDRDAPPSSDASDVHAHRYNLRPRQERNYCYNAIGSLHNNAQRTTSPKWFLFHIMVLSLFHLAVGNSMTANLTCADNGVFVHLPQSEEFEICAEQQCRIQHSTSYPLLIKFPPETTIHDYSVILKWHVNDQLATMETVCKGLDFCMNVDCWVCISILLNPECWPLGAILTIALSLYIMVAIVYLLLYVPITIGKPVRLILCALRWALSLSARVMARCFINILRKLKTTIKPSTSARMTAALAVVMLWSQASACQHVNVLEYRSTTCREANGRENCTVTLSEVLKINTFKQQACIRLLRNSTLIAVAKFRWKGLHLHCERQTLYFTRSTDLNVLDSKRCPHMGSCTGQKCAGVNSSSFLPELEQSNQYPGRTGCFESCGGPGCDCFYLSSGCLFFRIFAKPRSTKIYEVFRCVRWSEMIKLEVQVEYANPKMGRLDYIISMAPNVAVNVPPLQLTMTSLTLPPIPALNDRFITDGRDIAIWTGAVTPNLYCDSSVEAQALNCTLVDDCKCAPAESKVTCHCTPSDIAKEFAQIQLKLPVRTASWELLQHGGSSLIAKIPHMVSSEIIVEFHQTFDMALLKVETVKCSIDSSPLEGCYNCANGAIARVRCISEKYSVGEVLCDKTAFVLTCAPHGPESTLRFHLDAARQLLQCTISCGQSQQKFVLSGVLKYVNPIHHSALTTLNRNSTIYQEVSWPDLGHIFDVIMSWYKTLFIVLILVALALLTTYTFLNIIGLRILGFAWRALWTASCFPFRAVLMVLRLLGNRYCNRHAPAKKSA